MFKKFVFLTLIFLSGLLFVSFNSTKVLKAEEDLEKQFLTTEKNYILGNAGEAIDLTKISYTSLTSSQKFLLSDATIELTTGVSLSNNKLTASSTGIYELKVKYQNIEEKLVLAIKAKNDQEFLLFEENFDNVIVLPSDYTVVKGNVAISNGALNLNGMTTSDGVVIALLPDYLRGFSNYVIEVDLKMTQTLNELRWASVMFRYNTGNYFQMAVRQNATATNGVEFARSINNQWNVQNTKPYTEKLDSNKWYKLKVEVKDLTVKEYINDELIVTETNAKEYRFGNIGFQANYANVLYDNIKVTMPMDYIPSSEELKTYMIPNVYEPETGLVNPSTIIQTVDSIEDIEGSVGEVRPATLLMNVSDNLEIVNSANNVITSLKNALELIEGKVIPAFKTNSSTTALSLVKKLRDEKVKDFFLVSESATVIKAARLEYAYTRGVLDLSKNTRETLSEVELIALRDQTNGAQATAVIIPLKQATHDNVRFLQKRLITVWTMASGANFEQYDAVFSGANGIVTDAFNGVFEIYKTFPENSFIRKPFIINHRGLSIYDPKGTLSDADNEPENSVRASKTSIANGAEILEIDLHITADGEVVVFHDTSTGRLFDKDLPIAQSTLAQLKALNYKYSKYADEKILTFDEYLQNFVDDDIFFFVEIKSWVTGDALVKSMRETLVKYNMLGRTAIISFVPHQIINVKTYIPELSTGFLDYSGVYSTNKTTTVENVLDKVMTYPATMNHSYSGLTKENVKALSHRGITVWPWTIDGTTLDNYFLMGTGGNTTNTAQYYKDTWLGFDLVETNFTYNLNGSADNNFLIYSKQYTMGGNSYDMVPEYEIIDDGGTGIVLDRGQVVSAEKEGVVKIKVWMNSALPNQKEITIYNNIVTINVVKTAAEETNSSLPIILAIVGGVAVLGGAGALTFVLIKKKRAI